MGSDSLLSTLDKWRAKQKALAEAPPPAKVLLNSLSVQLRLVVRYSELASLTLSTKRKAVHFVIPPPVLSALVL